MSRARLASRSRATRIKVARGSRQKSRFNAKRPFGVEIWPFGVNKGRLVSKNARHDIRHDFRHASDTRPTRVRHSRHTSNIRPSAAIACVGAPSMPSTASTECVEVSRFSSTASTECVEVSRFSSMGYAGGVWQLKQSSASRQCCSGNHVFAGFVREQALHMHSSRETACDPPLTVMTECVAVLTSHSIECPSCTAWTTRGCNAEPVLGGGKTSWRVAA